MPVLASTFVWEGGQDRSQGTWGPRAEKICGCRSGCQVLEQVCGGGRSGKMRWTFPDRIRKIDWAERPEGRVEGALVATTWVCTEGGGAGCLGLNLAFGKDLTRISFFFLIILLLFNYSCLCLLPTTAPPPQPNPPPSLASTGPWFSSCVLYSCS